MAEEKVAQTPPANTSEQSQTPEKMVPESDVVKAKGGLQRQLEEVKTQFAESHSLRLQAEAKAQALEEKLAKSAEQEKELTAAKAALVEATKTADTKSAAALALRRTLISRDYAIPEDQVKDMNDEQLTMFEKALKVVKSAPGGGQYAAGGSAGSTAPPVTPMDRALRILQHAEKGTPNK